MRFAFVDAEKAQVPVVRLCDILNVSRSGFYAWQERPESKRAREDRRLSVLIRAAYEQGRGYYGSPRVLRELRNEGERVSRKRVVRLMQEQGLVARARRRYKATTASDHGQPIAPNLLCQNFAASAPNERWVGDTTELLVNGGKLYLAVILDLFSRYIVGWAVSAVNDRHLVIRGLDRALRHRRPAAGLIHHSDRGSPYASEDYRKRLEAHGIKCSMSRRGNCYDNAAMESWFSTLKAELGERFENPSKAKEELFDYIEVFYNRQRTHSAIGYVSPAEFERRGQLAA